MQATIVFQNIWNAINAVTETGERKWRYIILEGSSRSSKTRSLLQAFYLYAYSNRHKRLSVWRDVAKDCRDTVGYDMGQVYPYMEGYGGVSFHSTKSVYTFPTKSTIEVTGTDDANKVHGYQGDVIWLNEPYSISEDTFKQLALRTADVVLIDWNPKQAHFIDALKQDPRTLVLHSTFRDNPFCPEEQRLEILGYQPVSRAAVVQQKLISELEAHAYDCGANPLGFTEKQVLELNRCQLNERKKSANDFNWDVYGLGIKGERKHRIFRFTEIPDSEYQAMDVPAYVGVDWGTVDPWGILEAKYYDGALYLHELNYLSENEHRANMTPAEHAHVRGQDKDDGEGIVLWLFEKLRIGRNHPIICDNNRVLKISALRTAGYPAYPAMKAPGSIIDGIDLLSDLRVFYTASSKNLAKEQENYSRKVDRYGEVWEEPEDSFNHLMDPARYLAQFMLANGIIQRRRAA